MTRKIMIGNRKGGPGKTTTTVNLAYELSKLGKKVLVLDFDSQGDTTKYFCPNETEYFLGDALLDRKFDINDTIYQAMVNGKQQSGLFIIPARRGDIMTRLDMDMHSLPRREERLKLHIEKIDSEFDFILMDTSPGTSVLALNAVMAANEFLFPTEYAEHSIDGVETILEHIQDVTFKDEDEIKFKVVPVKIDKREINVAKDGAAYLQERWPDNTTKTKIYSRALFKGAEKDHVPASVFSSSHPAARFYLNLAKEILND